MHRVIVRVIVTVLVCVLSAPAQVLAAGARRDATGPVSREGVPPGRSLLKAAEAAALAIDLRAQDAPATGARPRQRGWMERHPVWTGAMIGFGATAGLILASGADDGIIGREGAMIFWGGVGAGVGALVGWGAGRGEEWEP